MKIAMIGQKGVPSRSGGVEIHVAELASGLVASGNQVDAYCRKRYNQNNEKKEYKGVRLIWIPSIATKHLDAIIYTFFSSVTALFRGYDIFHYHALGSSSIIWLPKLFGKKVVCTVHGLDWKRAKWGKMGKAYLKFGERVLFRYADEIIVLNEDTKRYYEKKYQGKENISVIGNGVGEPDRVDDRSLIEEYGLSKDSYILFLGRLVPEKGVHYLLKAYKGLKTDKKLVIAGGSSFTDDYLQKIHKIAEGNSNIIFTGFVSGIELEALYSNAYLYILPSDIEGMAISLLEAMSYHLCCLVSDIKENAIISENAYASFPAGNVDGLRARLQELLDMPCEDVKRIGDRAAVEVFERYNWKDVVADTIDVYHKTLFQATQEKTGNVQHCKILGVNVTVTNMNQVVNDTVENVNYLKGKYYCVSNVHTVVMASGDEDYLHIQNNAAVVLPDGAPLSITCRKRGYKTAQRVTGPDFMEEMFLRSETDPNLKHYFYGSTPETLEHLKENLKSKYPKLQIAGMYSPPFRELTAEEDQEIIEKINSSQANIVWVGLGAPKQEKWMYRHQNSILALMVGVGAGFDYHAGLLKRAPKWMQDHSLEWVYRLGQEPKRLWKRYLTTNFKYMWAVMREGRKIK